MLPFKLMINNDATDVATFLSYMSLFAPPPADFGDSDSEFKIPFAKTPRQKASCAPRRNLTNDTLWIGLAVSVSIHWLSEFVAGAIIGSVVGSGVEMNFREPRPKPHFGP